MMLQLNRHYNDAIYSLHGRQLLDIHILLSKLIQIRVQFYARVTHHTAPRNYEIMHFNPFQLITHFSCKTYFTTIIQCYSDKEFNVKRIVFLTKSSSVLRTACFVWCTINSSNLPIFVNNKHTVQQILVVSNEQILIAGRWLAPNQINNIVTSEVKKKYGLYFGNMSLYFFLHGCLTNSFLLSNTFNVLPFLHYSMRPVVNDRFQCLGSMCFIGCKDVYIYNRFGRLKIALPN